MKLHHLIVVLAIAIILGACGKRGTPVTKIEPADAEQLAASGQAEVRNVSFGEKFTLVGVAVVTSGDGLLVELAWKANGRQKLEYLVPVHALDANGNIVGQADYRQDEKRREVGDGEMWRDDVQIPRESLLGAATIGIGLMSDGEKWLPPDRGPRDADLLKLLLPVPPELSVPAAPSPYDGFLEAVNNSEIVGWVWQKDDPGKALEVEIYDGDTMLGRVMADLARADLSAAGIGDGKHGFRLEMPVAVRDGQSHRIAARVAGTAFELHKSPRRYQLRK